ncbi:MAG: MBOAT family protein [Chitinophagaceae bacterium]|nr:MAG: MBOAT family protein [Chitinophagaceae bacterium]
MLFNSFQFVLFFPIVTLVYFLLPHKYRWFHLLVASCVFYMAFVPVYILILFGTIIVDYFAGIWIERAPMERRRPLVIITVILNILVLCIFKYYNFFLDQAALVLAGLGIQQKTLPYLNILLPIGLSFHTFQALSYIFEVARGNVRAERHFGIYSLYVMFFPQLVAGPIERPQNMLHQFHEVKHFESDRVMIGMKIMLWGFVKKVVIADRLGLYVNDIYSNAYETGSLNLWLAVMIFFPFQIYCDFSGYSSIAIGTAKVLGFNLMENFRTPFFSLTTSELWNRWHISLSSWFRDYLYQPIVIALRDYGKMSVVAGLLITFFLSGLWHGAGLAFIFYGVFQGMVIAGEFLLGIKSNKLAKKPFGKLRGALITYFFFAISLIFFRALGLNKAGYIIQKMFWGFDMNFVSNPKIALFTYIVSLLSVAGLLSFEYANGEKLFYNNYALSKEIAISATLVILLILFGVFYNVSFIYFQF